MGKKSKRKKLKKKLRALLRSQMARSEQTQERITSIPASPEKKEHLLQKKKESPPLKKEPTKKEVVTPLKETQKTSFTQKLNPYFSYDIKKVLTTICVSLIIIVGISLMANFTNWITLLSEKISQFINL